MYGFHVPLLLTAPGNAFIHGLAVLSVNIEWDSSDVRCPAIARGRTVIFLLAAVPFSVNGAAME
jgi:hypothetical protein